MADIIIEGITHTVADDPYKIELTRGQKGSYGWTVTVRSKAPADALDLIRSLDQSLLKEYGGIQHEDT